MHPSNPGYAALSREYAAFYDGYVKRVREGDIVAALAAQVNEVEALVMAAPSARETYRYAPGKWSVREVMSHLIDAERVFGDRAFRISRGEAQPLPGFDENAYVAASGADARSLRTLFDEWAVARRLTVALFEHLPDEAWARVGTANGQPVSVRALARIAAGHVDHHLTILRERYGLE